MTEPLNHLDISDELTLIANLVDCVSTAAGNRIVPSHLRDPFQSVLDIASSRLRNLDREIVSHARRAQEEPEDS